MIPSMDIRCVIVLCLPAFLAGADTELRKECGASDQCSAGSDGFSTIQVRGHSTPAVAKYDTSWKSLITGTACDSEQLVPKDGGVGGTITCSMTPDGKRHFKFPVGEFDIDEQVNVPANTVIEGNANPNDPADKTIRPHPSTQTYFIATRGVSDPRAAYCGTGNNMQQGDAQKLRIGFLLNSNTVVKNINFQGRDTIRPWDNGALCGGAVFETPGCVSPGFCDGVGNAWVGKHGCFDHTGRPNNLITGDGRGVENVVVENVRLNELFLPSDPDTQALIDAQGSQIAVWVAQTQDGSATRNVRVSNLVSMLTRGDGINYHGNVQDSVVEDCHIENTGDDIYALWGGYYAESATNIVFRNNVGKNPGVTRNYGYGVCVAVYGAQLAAFTGMKCYDRRHWNPGQVPRGDSACRWGPNCNSCLAIVHDYWFGAVYPHGNSIHFDGNEYHYMDAMTEPIVDRPQIRGGGSSNAHIVEAPLS